jgi:hypothetical protein
VLWLRSFVWSILRNPNVSGEGNEARRSHDRWAPLEGEGVEIREISGRHEDVLADPYVRLLAL